MTFRNRNLTMEERRYADWMAQRRKRLKLPLRAVSAANGIPLSMIWNYENAVTSCPLNRRMQLESYYDRLEIQRFGEVSSKDGFKQADSVETLEITLPEMSKEAKEALSIVVTQLSALVRMIGKDTGKET